MIDCECLQAVSVGSSDAGGAPATVVVYDVDVAMATRGRSRGSVGMSSQRVTV